MARVKGSKNKKSLFSEDRVSNTRREPTPDLSKPSAEIKDGKLVVNWVAKPK